MNLSLFISNLLIVSSFALPQLVFNTQVILDIINNPNNTNVIVGKFIVFFDIDCLAQQTNGQDVIQDFLGLFRCYTNDPTVVDLYPHIVDTWIYMDKPTDCSAADILFDDGIEIEYNDYCLKIVEPDRQYQTYGTNQCAQRPVAPALYNLDSVSPQVPNGIQYVEYNSLYDPNMDIIIMDSGVDFTHPQFTGITTQQLLDTFPSQSTLDDHGTHVAGTAIGKFYGAFRAENTLIQLIDVRVFPTSGGTSSTNILNGYDAIIDYLSITNPNGKAIINLSFGGPNTNEFDIRLSEIRQVGGVSFAAAGNDGGDASLGSPASSEDTITVGALNQNPPNSRASFSNYDPANSLLDPFCPLLNVVPLLGSLACRRRTVDIWAPGVNILSAIPGGGSGFKSGTSMASPLVAGIAANILANNPNFEFDDVRTRLIQNAIDDVDDGAGSTDLPRVQATCTQYGVQSDFNLDIPNDNPAGINYNNENYHYNRQIKGGASMEMGKYMVEGFVILLFIILICFLILSCDQKSYNKANIGYNSYKVVEV